MLVDGDSDFVRPDHAAERLRLLGGGVPGDLLPMARSRLAVLPGTAHDTLMQRAEWLLSMVTESSMPRCPSAIAMEVAPCRLVSEQPGRVISAQARLTPAR
jgi:hypothetical protein